MKENETRTRIIVVDDDARLRELLNRYLSDQGYSVRAVADGNDMNRWLARERYDLMVLDLMMPDMHGFDVCEALRQDPAFAGLKILISSGKAYEVDKKAAKRLGADEYITKPFTIDQLMSAVNGLVGP